MSRRASVPDEGALRRRLAAEGLNALSWGNPAHDRYGVHDHGYDKVLVAVRGSIVFELAGQGIAVELAAGDRLHLPAGTSHGAVVGPRGVTCLEAHLPAGTLDDVPRRIAGWALTGVAGTLAAAGDDGGAG